MSASVSTCSEGVVSREDAPSETSDQLSLVLAGCLENLPPLSTRVVRIFISSTFTDTTLERNALMRNVYPKLKDFCREKHGLEFQVVDMRWGIRDEATDDHMTTELCMKEIETCQRLSVGPSFMLLLGQKYGYRPVPSIVPSREFEALRDVIKGSPGDVALLDTWYKCDENAVPPEYILQPISSILINYNNKRYKRQMDADQDAWWEIQGKLQKMFRKAAQVLFLTRTLDRDQMHNYFMSVTEREVRHGILTAKDTQAHCVAYLRVFTNMNLALFCNARDFVDMVGHDTDMEAQGFLSTLRDEKIPQKLPESNIGRFEVEWLADQEGTECEKHTEYVEAFCSRVFNDLSTLVDNATLANQKLSDDNIYGEVLQHLHACTLFCKIFQGRDELVELQKKYVIGERGDTTQPFVLYGASGCGKTSLLAKAFSKTVTWLPAESAPVMVLRFLGTSPDSSSVIPLLTSLCRQIAVNYDEPAEEIPGELSPLIQHLRRLLSCATAVKPLFIFLDSLDQLSAADGAHRLSWLPCVLPPHVRLVVSTLPDYYGILDVLRQMVTEADNYGQVTPLGENLGSVILKSWLAEANRQVTPSQWEVVQYAITKCNLPLFVKLVFDDICRWRSYSAPEVTSLANTIHDSINRLFDRIENQHGHVLVSRALGYLTAAKNGLSEAELEDLLSLDERVLNDVYQYHLPPVRRIPPLMWTRVRNDLPHYFAEREADGVTVIDWYHRQFMEAATQRYFRNINFASEMHSQLADYFLGVWGGKEKPFEYSELQKSRFKNLESLKGASDRKVPLQPLYFIGDDKTVTRYNLRKLNETPFHLIRSSRYDDLYKEVLFNFRWLHAKLSCMPLQAVLADFEDYLQYHENKDAQLLADALRLSASVVTRRPDMIGPQIVGRLLPYYNTHSQIQSLIKQCDSDGLEVNALSPCYHCMHTPGGPLQYSLEGHPFAPFGIAVTSDNKYLVSVSNVVIVWDLSTGGVFRQIDPAIVGIMQNLSLSPNDKNAVSFTNNDQIVVCFVVAGEVKVVDKVLREGHDSIVGTASGNDCFVVWTRTQWFVYSLECVQISAHLSKLPKEFNTLMHVELAQNSDKRLLVWKIDDAIVGLETEHDMVLQAANDDIEDFYCHSAIAISADHRTIYTCIAISNGDVVRYKREDSPAEGTPSKWVFDRSLGTNHNKLFAMTLSDNESYLLSTLALGYKLWHVSEESQDGTCPLTELKLPTGVRNIPGKNQMRCLAALTRDDEYVIGAVRKNVYVWQVGDGQLVKTLDIHFGRVMSLVCVGKLNKAITASIDKSIKIWNMDNIREEAYTIDRHEKPIEQLHLASNAYVGATTTRNCVGVWNLDTGRLMKTLATSAHSSIVTHSAITADGAYVVSAESGNVLLWDLAKEKVIHQDAQKDVQQLLLIDNDAKFLAVSKVTYNRCRCVCREMPSGQQIYEFEFTMKKYRDVVVTSDGLFLVVPMADKSGDRIGVYHTNTGTHMYDATPKFPKYRDYARVVAMPKDPQQVALIDDEKANVWDVKKKSFVRAVVRWNGTCTRDGKYGLYAPTTGGGLDLLDLKTGKTVHSLIPRKAEGAFTVQTLFTNNDTHAVYYHSGHRSVRVFRVADGVKIADYKAHAEIRDIASTPGGTSIVLGAVDGSLVVLAIADPLNPANKDFLSALPSRQLTAAAVSPRRHGKATANGSLSPLKKGGRSQSRSKFLAAVQVAKLTSRAGVQQTSRACVLS